MTVTIHLPCTADVSGCAARSILDGIGDRWTALVVSYLGYGTLRFSELRRRTQGISQRMLTLTLRRLERDGLVQRTLYPSVPPKVEYALTPLGIELLEAIQGLVGWAIAREPDIAAARSAFDTRAREGDAGDDGTGPGSPVVRARGGSASP